MSETNRKNNDALSILSAHRNASAVPRQDSSPQNIPLDPSPALPVAPTPQAEPTPPAPEPVAEVPRVNVMVAKPLHKEAKKLAAEAETPIQILADQGFELMLTLYASPAAKLMPGHSVQQIAEEAFRLYAEKHRSS